MKADSIVVTFTTYQIREVGYPLDIPAVIQHSIGQYLSDCEGKFEVCVLESYGVFFTTSKVVLGYHIVYLRVHR